MRRVLLALGFLVMFSLMRPAPALAVDCRNEVIPKISIFISPITVSRDTPVTLRIIGAPPAFRGETFRFQFDSRSGSGPFRNSVYLFDVRLDDQGNFSRTFTIAGTAASMPEGNYTPSLTHDFQPSPDRPFQVQVCNEPFDSTFNFHVEGAVTCLELGDNCTPGDASQTFCNPYAFCDPRFTPNLVALPQLTNEILNDADCSYQVTNGRSCSDVATTQTYTCQSEIRGRLDGNSSTPVQGITLCCANAFECQKAQGEVAADAEPPPELVPAYDFCQQVPDGPQRSACISCLGQSADVDDRIYTAVGCLRTSQTGLAGDLIRLGLGIGGGLALLSILASAFMYATSQGDQNKVKTAKDLATGAVTGLLFMIFSVIILNFVGVQILRLPGLSGPSSQSAPAQPEPPPAEPEQPPDGEPAEPPTEVWDANDVQWTVRRDESNPDFMQVCVQYPENSAGHSVAARMRPVIGDNVYDFFDQPLSPPQPSAQAPGTVIQCGSINLVDYSQGLIRNLVAQQTTPAISQQLLYTAILTDTGDFTMRSAVQIQVRPGQTLDEAIRDQVFGVNGLRSEFAGRVYLDVQVVADGEVIHEYRVQIYMPLG